MKKIFFIFLVLFFIIFLSFSNGNIEVMIFFTNDINGHPLSFNFMGEEKQGGMPARNTLIKKLSKGRKKRNILILNSGGIIRGRPESNLFRGIPDIIGMNNIGYYASGAGTSEFFESAEKLKEIKKKARFYLLCANVIAVNEKERSICDRYVIKEIGGINGIKIGIFSVITEDAFNEISEKAKKDFIFANPIDTAKQVVGELKGDRNKVDIIIALTHLGYYPDDPDTGSRRLASSVNGIDIIIDSRTGLKLDEPEIINNTKICQALKWGLYLGEIKLTIADKKINDFKYKLYPVNMKKDGKYIDGKIKESNFILSSINGQIANLDAQLSEEIAKIDGDVKLETKGINNKETEIGNIICDALLDYTKADIAFQNAGGIKENEFLSGSLNRKSLDKIIQYDNSVVVYNIKGEDILKIINFSMNNSGTGSFLQVAGIRFIYSKSSKNFTDVLINEKPIENSKLYKVAINSWLSDGADGYKIFTEIPEKIDYNIIHREVVYDYLAKLKTIKPVNEERIKIID